ncbi:GntR family transcriptional regulator [Mangrovibacter phragmitis]|uniref:GntR family transcriptional regulator n=1 Tax=Mangrovibacter phragmitis TaxID=1691903 RepID=A0A1B7L810_9ENTR|nr:PLP-dependent aminotransferase family protein [Mangrovibacter phragmitis]OAT78487.1 GntR family transcriptional regulator [Mangrovibacter phragmitis]
MTGYKEIYGRYRQQILDGRLKPGDRVPAIRVLASELQVARKTVEAAYEILTGEGYFVSQGAKGTRVNPALHVPAMTSIVTAVPIPVPSSPTSESKSELRLGIPALDAFPHKKWLLLSGKVARSLRPEEMVVPPVMGYQPLREAIANYLNISRGLNCKAEQIFITSGYRASLQLILSVLAQPNDKVVFEDPGFFLGQQLLKHIAPNLHYVPVDQQGINVDYLQCNHADARFAIVTPTHQSPLAVSLSLPRKHQLLEWAQQNNSWIIEDDYDGEFHYTRKVIPALKSLDTHERVIYTGTFSKTIMPAMRIGYLVMPLGTLRRFSELGQILETGLPLLPQKILAQFINEGHFYRHLKKMRILYQQRRRLMLDAIQFVFPDLFEFELTGGGMHIVAFLKCSMQDIALAELWRQHELCVRPLSSWYMQQQKRYGLLIGYTNIQSFEQAQAILQRVAEKTRAMMLV